MTHEQVNTLSLGIEISLRYKLRGVWRRAKRQDNSSQVVRELSESVGFLCFSLQDDS
jgi:hypothetical protein